MSTLGKICLVLTLLLLLLAMAPLPGKFGGWSPKALVIHNQWSTKLRAEKQKTLDAINSRREAQREFNKVMADISGLTIGWDKFWNVPPRGPQAAADTPTVAKQNGVLILNNIGTDNGLQDLQYDDENGNPQLAKPLVHAFYGGPEGFTYAGEFRATNIAAKRTELRPIRQITAQEFMSWSPNVAWRFRTMVPPGKQTTIDELYAQRMRIFEMTQQMDANINRQGTLLEKAKEALLVREGELLGGLDRDPVPTRPEFTVGLQQVNEDLEEERNQLLLEVDQLRRQIKEAYSRRDEAVSIINRKITELPGAKVHYAEATTSETAAE